MNRYFILTIVIMTSLNSCGGNNQTANTDVINQPLDKKEFKLEKLNSVSAGEVFSSHLKGTSSSGSTFNGDIKISNAKEEVVNGVLATPRIVDFKMYSASGLGSNSLQPIEAWNVTYYIESTTGNLISFKQTYFTSNAILNCRSSSPYHMPSSIKSGDFDVTPGFNCEAQNLEGGAWKAIATGDNQIILTIKTKTLDVLGNNKDFEIAYTLDATGNIVTVAAEGLASYKDL